MRKDLLLIAAAVSTVLFGFTALAEESAAGRWICTQEVDEFGDETGEAILKEIVEGTYTNTVVADSPLTVEIYDTGGEYSFKLLENNTVPASYYNDATLKTKVDDTVKEFHLNASSSCNDAVSVSAGQTLLDGLVNKGVTDEGYYGQQYLQDSLNDGKDIKCIIKTGASTYNFTIKQTNYKAAKQEYYNSPSFQALIDQYEGSHSDGNDEEKRKTYQEARSLYDQGKWQDAASQFETISGYLDSDDKAAECRYLIEFEESNREAFDSVVTLFDQGNYAEAAPSFRGFGYCLGARDYYLKCVEQLGEDSIYYGDSPFVKLENNNSSRYLFMEKVDSIGSLNQEGFAIENTLCNCYDFYNQDQLKQASEEYTGYLSSVLILQDVKDQNGFNWYLFKENEETDEYAVILAEGKGRNDQNGWYHLYVFVNQTISREGNP